MSPESNGPAPIPIENRGIPIPDDQVTPEMRANAMFSPDNVHPGAFRAPELVSQTGPEIEEEEGPLSAEETARLHGQAPVASEVQVVNSGDSPIYEGRTSREEMLKLRDQMRQDETDAAFDPEDAAVRDSKPVQPQADSRFTAPTDAQIAKGKQFGLDLEKQEKYYTPDEWAARNNPKE